MTEQKKMLGFREPQRTWQIIGVKRREQMLYPRKCVGVRRAGVGIKLGVQLGALSSVCFASGAQPAPYETG